MNEQTDGAEARSGPDTDLRATVWALADADETLTEDAKLAILEALGDDVPSAPATDGSVSDGNPVYLTSIGVKGFRGVGPEVRIPLKAGPGLVVISGRNGSGKSTVAEALELALTGRSYRWHNRTAVWTQDWRNLHCGDDAGIRLELTQENAGPMTVGVDWAVGADLHDFSMWSQRPGAKRQPGRDPLGWGTALDMYRPLLSYDELGGVLDGPPSELFDKLHTLLGLEKVTEAGRELADQVRQLGAAQADLRQRTTAVKALLATADDARASQGAALLAKRKVDVDAVEALAVGSAAPRSEAVEALHRLSRLTVPTRVQVVEATGRLRAAVAAMAEHAGTAAERSAQHADLLTQALTLHRDHGDQPCPVCGVGALDAGWAERTRAALDQDRAAAAELASLRSELAEARRAVRMLAGGVSVPVTVDGPEVPELAGAVAAHELWVSAPTDDLGLAQHLDDTIDLLVDGYTRLRTRAAALLTEHEDRWTPVALHLAQWVSSARRADEVAPRLAVVKQAAIWLKANESTLRNQRIAPLADRARYIWAMLRQESNVDLGAIRLEGAATRRRVELLASVDGAEAGALGVMSQGELHALALALFLPRATAAESPFRFIVLDDPIQAMDPSKVEGFVQVMAELAKERQVIVLSHDDRLADAVRRSSLKASMYEVTRGAKSAVTVRETLHPALRYLQDAETLSRDDAVPDEAKQRVLPGLFRMALESAAYETFSRHAHETGIPRVEVEQQWEQAQKLKDRLGLALRTQSDGQTMSWVKGGAARSRAFHLCNGGVHGAVSVEPEDFRSVRTAIQDLRGTLA